VISTTTRWAIVVAFVLGPTGLAWPQEKPLEKDQGTLKKAEEDYRQFFREPKTALEFWAAMKFEIDTGKFDLAAAFLKGFLSQNPSDAELLEIEAQDGMASFLRLLSIEQLRPQAKPLVDRVSSVVRKYRGDPERLRKFIANLSAPSEEEQAYALRELRLAGPVAVPYLVEALRGSVGEPDHPRILQALHRMDRDAVPPLLAALDINDATLQFEIIDLLQQRAETAAVPFLWFPSASPKQAETVRRKAIQALAFLLGMEADRLPAAKVALTREAERYYRHQVALADSKAVPVWQWNGKVLAAQPMPATQAEEYYGLRFAGQAIDLDPNFEPAQVLFLSLALEKGFERAGIDQPLDKGAPTTKELLKIVNPELLNAALDLALEDHRLPVILGTIRTIGELGDIRATMPTRSKPLGELGEARPLGETHPREPALQRALYYPDRRVQLAAAHALLGMPTDLSRRNGAHIVEILRRTIGGDFAPKVLVAGFDTARANALADKVRQAGFQTEVRSTGREVLHRLKNAADIDALVVDERIPDPGLASLLGQLRADSDVGLLPVLITVDVDQPLRSRPASDQRRLELLERSPLLDRESITQRLMAMDKEDVILRVLDATEARGRRPREVDAVELRQQLRKFTKEQLIQKYLDLVQPFSARDKYTFKRQLQAVQAEELHQAIRAREDAVQRLAEHYRNVTLLPLALDVKGTQQLLHARIADTTGRPLSPAERKANAQLAIDWLKQLAARDVPGYDVGPAQAAILKALLAPDLAPPAIAAAGRLHGTEPQRALAEVVLRNPSPDVRAAAAVELSHHIQREGLALTKALVQGIEELHATSTDPKIRGSVALVVGSLRPDTRATAQRLLNYRPAPWSAGTAEDKAKEPSAKEEEKPRQDKEKDGKEKEEKEK
jgi:hypothetical protein